MNRDAPVKPELVLELDLLINPGWAEETGSSTREPGVPRIPHLGPRQLWYGYD